MCLIIPCLALVEVKDSARTLNQLITTYFLFTFIFLNQKRVGVQMSVFTHVGENPHPVGGGMSGGLIGLGCLWIWVNGDRFSMTRYKT